MKYNRAQRILPLILFVLFFTSFCNTPDKMKPADFQKIQTGFVTPYDSNTLWCYWYWIGDNISKDGIT